jgi:preprotein translocase subunit YajC
MSLLSFLGITDALAGAAPQTAAAGNGGFISLLPMLIGFFAISYFLIIRPQSKRLKAQRKLLSEIAKGDEVITAGGMLGRIVKVSNDFVTLAIADEVEIHIQKTSIANILPKGTIKSI